MSILKVGIYYAPRLIHYRLIEVSEAVYNSNQREYQNKPISKGHLLKTSRLEDERAIDTVFPLGPSS